MKDWSTGKKVSFAVLLFICAVFIGVSLVGCTTEPPTPFQDA